MKAVNRIFAKAITLHLLHVSDDFTRRAFINGQFLDKTQRLRNVLFFSFSNVNFHDMVTKITFCAKWAMIPSILDADGMTSVYLHRITRNHEKGNYTRSVYYRAAGRFSVR